MNTIKILDDHVINQIAAGEVVERPASVVKELIENSLDAGASRIDLFIESGGCSLIEIRDNGSGIPEEQMERAFLRHATSKIRTESDLTQLSTLGFRGEALPSIAAVSKVTMLSRYKDSMAGHKLVLEGGEVITREVIGHSEGTTIRVKDLFYNTPARKKFMGSPRAEAMRINQLFRILALSRPDIAFRFYKDKQLVASTPGNARLLDVIVAFFGVDEAKLMLPVSYQRGPYQVNGYIGSAELTRHNRQWQYFYVNGRAIENEQIRHALERVFRTLIPARRYPIAFLFIDIPSDKLDVNVHPAKSEIRFADKKSIHGLITAAIQDSLTNNSQLQANQLASEPSVTQVAEIRVEPKTKPSVKHYQLELPAQPIVKDEVNIFEEEKQKKNEGEIQTNTNKINEEPLIKRAEKQEPHPELEQIMLFGQIHNSYIALQTRQGFAIIDQHAAHERVIYEKLLKVEQAREKHTQMLAVPLTLSFSGGLAENIRDYLTEIREWGISLESFGPNSFLVRGLPDFLAGSMDKEAIRTIFTDTFTDNKHIVTRREEMLKQISCKAAIKLRQRLSRYEMIELIRLLAITPNWLRCPHGRPTCWFLSMDDLDKNFLRR